MKALGERSKKEEARLVRVSSLLGKGPGSESPVRVFGSLDLSRSRPRGGVRLRPVVVASRKLVLCLTMWFGSSKRAGPVGLRPVHRLFIKVLHGSGAQYNMDQQQFETVCAMFLEALGKVGNQGGERGGGGGNRALLDGKAFGRLETFAGEEKKWKEWLFNVKVVIRSCNVEVWKWLVWIEGSKDQWRDEMWDGPDGWKAQMMSPDGPGHEVYEKASAELFGQLCLLTTGEANVLVRGAFGENGFVAWKKLLDRYDAKTPGRMLKVLLGVLRPSEIKNVKEVPKRMEEWEIKVKDLEREFDEKLSPNIKLAVFVGMMPKELQDEVYRSAENGKAEFEKAKDRIRAIAGNRIAQDTPQPMDIGQMAVEEDFGLGGEEGTWGI